MNAKPGSAFPRGARICVLVLCIPGAGCGPTLRDNADFTPKLVRSIRFEDQCQLQSYFDQDPPAPAMESETVLSADGAKISAGRVTLKLERGEQQTMFYSLLDRFYRRLPVFDRKTPPRVTVQYYTNRDRNVGEEKTMPIGAQINLEVGTVAAELPYHPCVSAFFFGRTYYQLRRQLLTKSAIVVGSR